MQDEPEGPSTSAAAAAPRAGPVGRSPAVAGASRTESTANGRASRSCLARQTSAAGTVQFACPAMHRGYVAALDACKCFALSYDGPKNANKAGNTRLQVSLH